MDTRAKEPFFATPRNIELFRHFANALENIDRSATTPPDVAPHLKQIIELIIGNAERFDEYATANIEWIGTHFISEVSGFLAASREERLSVLNSIFVSAYRFLRELEFTQPGGASFEVLRVNNYVNDHLSEFPGSDQSQLVFATYLMPAQFVKRLINHPSITDFRRFTETVDAARKLKEQWDDELTKRQTVLNALNDKLKNLTSEFNFVGLVHGFQQLARTKSAEKNIAFVALLLLGLVMLAPIAAQVGFVTKHIETIESHKSVLIYTLPTIIALEVILLYFFRVVLSQFRSVKAQLLQLDLRIALCQFIESYAEYSAKIKGQDKNALTKFESLIFSGLVAEESELPSTFDGAEQIAALIKSIRGA